METKIVLGLIIGFGAFWLFEKVGEKQCDCIKVPSEKQIADKEPEEVEPTNNYKAMFVNFHLPAKHIITWNNGKPKEAKIKDKHTLVPVYRNLTFKEFQDEVAYNKNSKLTIQDFYKQP
tara:strand:+ start:198 stop:554 length:357 start_codon:yes stop_codon:yes gene_type:complete